MSGCSRRHFLRTGIAAGVVTATGSLPQPAQAAVTRSATDWVPLGNSGVKVTRLAFGTGTFGGRVQRELGQEQFTKLVRYAYDRGIRFFETADAYREMPGMLATALKGIPRDSYKLMTKYRIRETENPKATIDRLRKDLNSEYVDIMLLHCVRRPNWQDELARLRDEFSEAKQKKIMLAHGASCHGLLPLRAFPGNDWLDVALLRVNHNGTRMDAIQSESNEKGNVPEVVSQITKIHKQGTGVIGMKLIGEGAFTTPELRDASLKYVVKLGTVDSMTIGYKSTAEIDEAIERVNKHLNA
jgi:aryl-alcohol dehydrogenase-like predicted oxidoreductase